MTAATEPRTIAVFYIIDGMHNGRVINHHTVTVEHLSDDDAGVQAGLGRFLVRGRDDSIRERFTGGVAAMRYALGLAGWWSQTPTQI